MSYTNSKRGVLLLNMGGPNNIGEVELFLRNMFADKNILPVNPLLRKFIGNIIVKKRLHEAQENYRILGGKSPLNDITASLCNKVEDKLSIPVLPAMRYVPPSAKEALSKFKNMGIEEIILFPMYPHYSTTTTLSSIEDVKERAKELEYYFNLTIIEPYYSDIQYVDIQCDRILKALGERDASEYELILSAHGLPVSIIEAGDPYQKQIEENSSLIADRLAQKGVRFKKHTLAYQSKVGNSAWLEPNLIDILRNPDNLKVLISPLSFTIDNSETLFELDIEHREIAEKIRFDDYIVAKCPNDDEDFAEFISNKLMRLNEVS